MTVSELTEYPIALQHKDQRWQRRALPMIQRVEGLLIILVFIVLLAVHVHGAAVLRPTSTDLPLHPAALILHRPSVSPSSSALRWIRFPYHLLSGFVSPSCSGNTS
jgi:hypothetical protein